METRESGKEARKKHEAKQLSTEGSGGKKREAAAVPRLPVSHLLFPLRLPFRYSGIGELVAIEPAVHHDTIKRRDERGGFVLTGEL